MWTLLILFIISIISVIYILFSNEIKRFIQLFIKSKFGLILQLKKISVKISFQHGRIVLCLSGLDITILNRDISNDQHQPLDSMREPLRLPPALVRLLGICRFFALHIDTLSVYPKKSQCAIHIDYILFKPISSVNGLEMELGPVKVVAAEQQESLVEMVTVCLVTVFFHLEQQQHLAAEQAVTVDLNIQLGKCVAHPFRLGTLFRQQSQSQSGVVEQKKKSGDLLLSSELQDILRSVRVTIQELYFVSSHSGATASLTFHNAFLNFQPQFTLISQLNIDLIQLSIQDHALVHVPNMEIKLTLDNSNDTTMPTSDFAHLVWIMNEPLLSIPFHKPDLIQACQSLLSSPSSTPSPVNDQQPPTCILSNLPACTFALVLKSPKLEFLGIRHNCIMYTGTDSLIIRLSGEYILNKGRDVPSASSSSSATRLDTMFAKQEFKWIKSSSSSLLSNNSGNSVTASSGNLVKRKRFRFNIARQTQPLQQCVDDSAKSSSDNNKEWSFRLSARVILQKLRMGCQNAQGEIKDFVRIKNTTLVLKSRMDVLNTHLLNDNGISSGHNMDRVRYDTVFSAGHLIQSEIAVDTPTIYLWDAQDDVCASLYWIKLLPQHLRAFTRNKRSQTVETKKPLAPWIYQLVMRNTSFGLDVTDGSIQLKNTDPKDNSSSTTHQQKVPEGYIDNAPKETVISTMVLSTQNFTFVCEGPGNNSMVHENDDCWKIRCRIEKLSLQHMSQFVEEKKKGVYNALFWISQFNLAAAVHDVQKSVTITAQVKKYGFSYSISGYYAILLLARSLKMMKAQLTNQFPSAADADIPSTDSPSPKFQINVSVNIKRGDLRILLPGDKKLFVRIDEWALESNSLEPDKSIKFRNIMLLGESPLHEDQWEQLIELDKVTIFIDKQNNIGIKSKKIMVTLPYKFIFAHILDNGIGLFKAVKALTTRVLSTSPEKVYTFFGPTVKSTPVLIPCIQVRTKLFTIQFDDDPFEARLRLILRTGLLEQQRRLAYCEAFDEKAQGMLSSVNLATSGASSETSSMVNKTSLDSTDREGDISQPSLSSNNTTDLAEVYEKIDIARKKLLEVHSQFWIKNIDKAIHEEQDFYENINNTQNYASSFNYNHDDQCLNDELAAPFIIDILPRPLYSPLTTFSAQFAKVNFQPTNFPIDQTRQFIHSVGNGIPLSFDFSLLIPFHLSIKAGSTWIKLRDYPLPLLHIPPMALSDTSSSNRHAWSLDGEYVIGDELGNSSGSRAVPIPIIPGYTLQAIRTASPLKFYSVVNYFIYTPSMSAICWSVSYSPAISDIIRAFDTLLPSPADPSPKLGFWDKVRFMLHTQIEIRFVGGGDLAFLVKGTRDPYSLQGRGAGIAKVWSQDVVWLLGYQNKENEFMQIISNAYAFGVPDLVRGGYVPDLQGHLPCQGIVLAQASDREEEEKIHQFSKVVVKLTDGVRMGIGMLFERLDCHPLEVHCRKCSTSEGSRHKIDRCRSRLFYPHYNVLFRSVQQVERCYDKASYDTFRGFRSDFIHLSFSIVQLGYSNQQSEPTTEEEEEENDSPFSSFGRSATTSQNTMHLSPCFIDHFIQWYSLFGGPISIPIRQGRLFPTLELGKSKRFGEHLDTIKYKVVVQPLAIAFFCSDQKLFAAAGLKARINSFHADFHQRKEVVPGAKKTRMNFHEREVELSDIDLRVIKAVNETSSASSGASVKSTMSRQSSYEESSQHQTLFNDAMSSSFIEKVGFKWIDTADYIWLDWMQPLQKGTATTTVPYNNIQVLPFAFSPMVYFVRQQPQSNDDTNVEKRDYLRYTHDCIMETGIGSREFQKFHLDRRASELSIIIDNHEKELDIILQAKYLSTKPNHDIQLQHKILTEKVEYLRFKRYMLFNYIGELALESELNSANKRRNRDSFSSSSASISSMSNKHDELPKWEALMGRFYDRYYIHNPQIIWNSSVRDAAAYLRDLQYDRSDQTYNLSAKCLQFLQDVVRTAEIQKQQQQQKQQKRRKSGSSSCDPDPEEDDMDKKQRQNDTQELIEKLLSERSTNFVAYNEKEEDKSRNSQYPQQQQQDFAGIYAFGGDDGLENINDPNYQYKSMTDGYEMKSKFTVDLFHPQVNFQSDKGLDHLVLLTNERIHIKAFAINDNSSNSNPLRAAANLSLVKDRIIVNMDQAQLLVAKRVEFMPFDLFTQNCYGHFREPGDTHWTAWVQPEQIWFYRENESFERFQRVANELSGTIQLDRYNHLRIKMNRQNTTTTRQSPFEDRTNSMLLHFPKVKITLNSLQSHVLYYTGSNLLQSSSSSPRKKERVDRFKQFMLNAEQSELAATVRHIALLQNQSRALLDKHQNFSRSIIPLDMLGKREYVKNKKMLQDNLEDLYLAVEAIRHIQTVRHDVHLEETDRAMRFYFTSHEIVWKAMRTDYHTKLTSPLCKCTLLNTKFTRLNKQDDSSKNTVEVGRMQVINTTENPVFVNVLDAYVEEGQAEMGARDYSRQKVVHGVLELLPPVAGISVIKHLELNLLPMRLSLSTAFGSAIKDYFFPKVPITANSNNRAGLQPEETSSSNSDNEDGSSDDGDDDDDYDDDDEMKSLNEYSEAQENSTIEPEVEQLKISSRRNSANNNTDAVSSHSRSGAASVTSSRQNSFASFEMFTKNMREMIVRRKKPKKKKAGQLTMMRKRSSTNRTFIYIRVPATRHCLSVQGPSRNTIYNLYDFPIKLPRFEYRNKTWSTAEIVDEFQKQILFAILRHSPGFIKNKFSANKRPSSDYATLLSTSPSSATTSKANSIQSNHSTISLKRENSFNTIGSNNSALSRIKNTIIYNKKVRNSDGKSAHEIMLVSKSEDPNTEEEDEETYEDDAKSLYSIDPEEASKEPEKSKLDNLVRKGRILFGDKYKGVDL